MREAAPRARALSQREVAMIQRTHLTRSASGVSVFPNHRGGVNEKAPLVGYQQQRRAVIPKWRPNSGHARNPDPRPIAPPIRKVPQEARDRSPPFKNVVWAGCETLGTTDEQHRKRRRDRDLEKVVAEKARHIRAARGALRGGGR